MGTTPLVTGPDALDETVHHVVLRRGPCQQPEQCILGKWETWWGPTATATLKEVHRLGSNVTSWHHVRAIFLWGSSRANDNSWHRELQGGASQVLERPWPQGHQQGRAVAPTGWGDSSHVQQFPRLATEQVRGAPHQPPLWRGVGPALAGPQPSGFFFMGLFERQSVCEPSPNNPWTQEIARSIRAISHVQVNNVMDCFVKRIRACHQRGGAHIEHIL